MSESRIKLGLARVLRAASLGFLVFGCLVIPVIGGDTLFGRNINWTLNTAMWHCLLLGVLLAGFSLLLHRQRSSGFLLCAGLLLTSPIWLGLICALFE